MIKKYKKGFTLIELLVVVAILGLLATIVAVSLTSARARARDARRVSDIRQIELALELYYAAHQQYPIGTDASTTAFSLLRDEGFLNMSADPEDPTTGKAYCYTWGAVTGAVRPYQYYHIGAVLENSDSDMLCSDRDFDSGAVSSTTWASFSVGDCTYTSGRGFNGVGSGTTCAENADKPTYDRGVLPQ
jgi:prepilin-type N-terminal cleavage/methylation domain-containing protein